MSLVEDALDLEIFPSDAVSFIPVYLGWKDFAVLQPDRRNALALSPAPAAIELAQTRNLSNRRTGRECLDMRDLAEDLEVHLQADHMRSHLLPFRRPHTTIPPSTRIT